LIDVTEIPPLIGSPIDYDNLNTIDFNEIDFVFEDEDSSKLPDA